MRGTRRGAIRRTDGAWLVAKHDDGTTYREPLPTFNPFARPFRPQTADGRRDRAGVLAWMRERARCRRAEAARRVAAGGQR